MSSFIFCSRVWNASRSSTCPSEVEQSSLKKSAMTWETVIPKTIISFISPSSPRFLYGTCLSSYLARLFQKIIKTAKVLMMKYLPVCTAGRGGIFVFFIFCQLFLFSSSADQWAIRYHIRADQITTWTFWVILDQDPLLLLLDYCRVLLMQCGLFTVLQYYCSLNAEFCPSFFIYIHAFCFSHI